MSEVYRFAPEPRLLDSMKMTLTGFSWKVVAESLVVFGALNLLWEMAQLPLYDIWHEATPTQIIFAVLHCTAGDMLIGINSVIVALLLALAVSRSTHPPLWAVTLITVLTATAYTVYSEWFNIYVRKAWSYSDLMPTIPPFGTGLSPLLQRIILPVITIGIFKLRRDRVSCSLE